MLSKGAMSATPKSGSFETYLSEVADHKLLGKHGEIALAKEIEALEIAAWNLVLSHKPAAKLVERVLADNEVTATNATDLRNADRERVLFDTVMQSTRWSQSRWVERKKEITIVVRKAQRVRQKFVEANLKLVVNIATKFRTKGLSLEDLVQEGNLGLIKALDKYDHHMGFRFSTYATWWIKHAMQRASLNKQHTVRHPIHIQDLVQKIVSAKYKITAEKKREATDDEVAEVLGISVEKVRNARLRACGAQTVSLEDDVGPALWLSDGRDSPLDILAQGQDAKRLGALVRTLKPIQATILQKRFGLGDEDPITLRAIGEELGLSRERIRQIQNEALARLHYKLELQS